MGIYVFSRDVLLEILEQPGVDFGKEIIPKALGDASACNSYIFRGYWADVGTIEAFYDANIQLTQRGAPFNFFHPRWPIYTHPRFLPATRAYACRCDPRSSPKAAISISARSRTRSSASGRTSDPARASRARCCSAPIRTKRKPAPAAIPFGIGRDVVLDRVIVDKNARIADGVRLVNAAGVDHADGDGYYIRDGIIIVPKGAQVAAGFTL